MICKLSEEINLLREKSIFHPNLEVVLEDDWNEIIYLFQKDYNRYYNGKIEVLKIKYYPGLLATLFYRISRKLFLSGLENDALEFSSLGCSLTSIELYYSAEIGESFKINHGMGTVVGSRTKIGNNCMLHQGVTIGDKNGGRASLGNDVIVYPGAVIVGNIYIGDNSIVGANVFLDKSCNNNSKIF